MNKADYKKKKNVEFRHLFYLEAFFKPANIFTQLTFYKPRKLEVIDPVISLHIDQCVLNQRFLSF